MLSHLTVIPLLALLTATAVTVARMRDLWAAVMLTGIYSFLGAGWMLLLDAPDVAFTEAAVGAGISTVLMLVTLSLTSRTVKPISRFPWAALIVVLLTGGALVYGTLDMPEYGDPEAPIHRYPQPGYVEQTRIDMGGGHGHDGEHVAPSTTPAESDHAPAESHEVIPNIVTVVLASYRGYDTLGETTVIFTAAVAVILLMRTPGREERPS